MRIARLREVDLPGPINIQWTYANPASEKNAELISPNEVTRYKIHLLFKNTPVFDQSRIMPPVVDHLNSKGEVVPVRQGEDGGTVAEAQEGVEGAVARLVKARRGRKACKTT